jgi:hypothetical protein
MVCLRAVRDAVQPARHPPTGQQKNVLETQQVPTHKSMVPSATTIPSHGMITEGDRSYENAGPQPPVCHSLCGYFKVSIHLRLTAHAACSYSRMRPAKPEPLCMHAKNRKGNSSSINHVLCTPSTRPAQTKLTTACTCLLLQIPCSLSLAGKHTACISNHRTTCWRRPGLDGPCLAPQPQRSNECTAANGGGGAAAGVRSAP